MGSWFKVLGHWDMHTVVSYLSAFWTVVVMNCVQPVNWKYCYRVDQWLVPGVMEGVEILSDINCFNLCDILRLHLTTYYEYPINAHVMKDGTGDLFGCICK